MGIEITLISFLLPVLIAYALGALPVAYTIGRINGINVFEVGSHQAGATNIWREVSRKQGVIVTAVDAMKGLTAILLARHMGLEGAELLIPAGAAIAGHWNSPFTKFKGGDGVVTLMGVAIGIVPLAVIAPLSLGLLIAVTLNSKLSHPSLWGGIFGYLLFITLSFQSNSGIDPVVVYGLTGIGLSIMLHSMYFHKRRKEYFRSPDVFEEEPEPTFGQDQSR